jgi:hypothetical protein
LVNPAKNFNFFHFQPFYFAPKVLEWAYPRSGGFPMNCHYCGTELTGRETFCRYCGTRLNPVPVAEPVPVKEFTPAPQPAAPVTEPAMPVQPDDQPQQPAAPAYQPARPAEEEPLFDFERQPAAAAPRIQLPTRRSLAKMIIFSILTLGIYPIVIWSRLVTEVNITTSRYDGKRTLSFFGMLLLSPMTMGILPLVWLHKLCNRIGDELERRNLDFRFSARDFWLWHMLLVFLCGVCAAAAAAMAAGFDTPNYWVLWVLLVLSLLCTVGPLIFIHKLVESVNLINDDFNQNG